MTEQPAVVREQRAVTLPRWDVALSILLTDDGAYFVIRELCRVLGIKDVQSQLVVLSERAVYQGRLKKLPVKTRGGVHQTWCIQRNALGMWLGHISDKKVRPEIQPQLVELQTEMLNAADLLLFGLVDAGAAVTAAPADRALFEQLGQFMAQFRAFHRSFEALAARVDRLEGQVSLGQLFSLYLERSLKYPDRPVDLAGLGEWDDDGDDPPLLAAPGE